MKLKKNNHYQGVSHLLIIAFVPLLMAGVYFAEAILVKALLAVLLLFLLVFIWKKILIH